MTELTHKIQDELFEQRRRGFLKPRLARQFEFTEVPDALEFVARGKTAGRALVKIGSEAI